MIFGEDTKATIGEYFEINGALDMNFVGGSNNNGLYCNTFSVVPSFLMDVYSEGKISLFGNTVLDLPKQSIWTNHFLQGLQSLNLNICSSSPSLTDTFGNNYAVVSLNNRWWSAENWKTGDLLWQNNMQYGGYSLSGSGLGTLPVNWRLPTKTEFEDLVNSLGANAYSVLTSPGGFNAKSYGNIYEQNTSNPIYQNNTFNQKAVFLSSTVDVYQGGNGPIYYTHCLVIDFATQTVSVQSLLTSVTGASNYQKNYYNARLIRN